MGICEEDICDVEPELDRFENTFDVTLFWPGNFVTEAVEELESLREADGDGLFSLIWWIIWC